MQNNQDKRCPNCNDIISIIEPKSGLECLECNYPNHNKTVMIAIDYSLLNNHNKQALEMVEYEN